MRLSRLVSIVVFSCALARAADTFTANLLEPDNGTAFTSRPSFRFSFNDINAAGIVLESVSASMPGCQLEVSYDEQTGTWTCGPDTDLSDGVHTLTVSATN